MDFSDVSKLLFIVHWQMVFCAFQNFCGHSYIEYLLIWKYQGHGMGRVFHHSYGMSNIFRILEGILFSWSKRSWSNVELWNELSTTASVTVGISELNKLREYRFLSSEDFIFLCSTKLDELVRGLVDDQFYLHLTFGIWFSRSIPISDI